MIELRSVKVKALLLGIANKMVDYPDQVTVKEIDGASTTVLELSVAKQDLGKIIGQKGRNITAIRTLITASAAKQKKRIIIEVVE